MWLGFYALSFCRPVTITPPPVRLDDMAFHIFSLVITGCRSSHRIYSNPSLIDKYIRLMSIFLIYTGKIKVPRCRWANIVCFWPRHLISQRSTLWFSWFRPENAYCQPNLRLFDHVYMDCPRSYAHVTMEANQFCSPERTEGDDAWWLTLCASAIRLKCVHQTIWL